MLHNRIIRLSAWVIFGLLVVSMTLSACSEPLVNETLPAPEAVVPSVVIPTEAPVLEDPTADSPQPTTIVETDPIAEPTQTAQEAAQEVPVEADPASFPDPAGFSWNLVASGFDNLVDLGDPADGTGRLFVIEKPGIISILQNGSILAEPFLNITDRVMIRGGEMGLLGIAFHPNFSENGYFYVNYTSIPDVMETRISRFQVSSGDPNRADPGSEKILLVVEQPYRNHNGGGVAFGPDGYLYIGLGDGGSAGDPEGYGQSLNTYLGKLLRIDVDGGDPYGIPTDNPFAEGGGLPEIWAYGLRNPWRFSFDRSTGDLFIGDVGQNQWEEVNFAAAGTTGGINYGWDYREAAHPYEGEPPSDAQLVDPIFEYQHAQGCSVTGGYTYRGDALPEFNGVHLVGDYCSGRVWGLISAGSGVWQSQELFQTGLNISSFAQDNEGELYLLHLGSGSDGAIYKLERN